MTTKKKATKATARPKKRKANTKKLSRAQQNALELALDMGLAMPGQPTLSAAHKKLIAETKRQNELIAQRQAALKKLTFAELSDAVIGGAEDFYYVLAELRTRSEKPFKMQVGPRWYPVPLKSYHNRKTMFGSVCEMQVDVKMFDINWPRRPQIWDSDFVNGLGNHVTKKFSEILSENGLAITTDADMVESKSLVGQALAYRNSIGESLEVTGSVLQKNDWFFGPKLIEIPFGTKKHPRICLVESELEMEDVGYDDYYDDDDDSHDPSMPFVRVFSLDMKKYVYVDVRDVQKHQYQDQDLVMDKLVLPADLKEVVTSVFDAKDVFGDLFAGRHGGMIVLANGTPGIGKTLTAEVFAEKTKRPLYVLEMGELGVQLDKVEKSLQLIFTRAARWNTVLLFDEVDIFLSKRTEHDLERNAIVGVFLRLLDQYKGMLFLTTNRAEIIDPAFASRITLRLDYPELSVESRRKIWEHMLASADLKIDGASPNEDLDIIATNKLNGRQIRNVVRLLKATTSTDAVSLQTVQKYVKYSPATK